MADFDVTLPQVDLFGREKPASLEGSERAWDTARTAIDYGSALIGTGGSFRRDHVIRDAVLLALLRRATITVEAVYQILERGLLEPAVILERTVLDIELSMKLIHRDRTDVLAHRLAAYHYYALQRHGQDMLSDPSTRVDVLGPGLRIPEVVEVSKSYARLLESSAFDAVRDAVRKDQYWHGMSGAREAFRSIGQESDYHMPYDGATWFVHAVNVDFDYDPSPSVERFHLKSFATRDLGALELFLANAVFRYYAILEVYVAERGFPAHDAFAARSEVTVAQEDAVALNSLQALGAALLSAFPGKRRGESSPS